MLICQDHSNGVIIDNDVCESATIIQVSSARHEILFEAVQVLTDLSLIITKAYVSCDEGWFMDVFYVTNNDGQKIQDEGLLDHMRKALAAERYFFKYLNEAVEVVPNEGSTMILLRGTDRLGLLSELFEVLTHHGCNILNAEAWTHMHHAFAVVCVTDEFTGCGFKDSKKISRIKKDLQNLIKPSVKLRSPSPRQRPENLRSDVKIAKNEIEETLDARSSRALVTVSSYKDRDYTLIIIRCNYRLKVLFDTLSALMFMQYVVFHGTVTTGKTRTYQEYYIRHVNGCPICTKSEREHLQKILEETIDNSDSESEGVEVEICTDGQLGLLSDVATVLRDKWCWIKRAIISITKHNYLITDIYGKAVDPRTLNLIQEQIGHNMVQVTKSLCCLPLLLQRKARGSLFGNLLRRISLRINKLFTSDHFG